MTLTPKIISQSFENGMNGVVTVVTLEISKQAPGQKVAQLVMQPNFGFQGIVKDGISFIGGVPGFDFTMQFRVDPEKQFLNMVVRGDAFPQPVGITMALLFSTPSDIRQCTGLEFLDTFKNQMRPIAMVQTGKMYELEMQKTLQGKKPNPIWNMPPAGQHPGAMAPETMDHRESPVKPARPETAPDAMDVESQRSIQGIVLKVITADTQSLKVTVTPTCTVQQLKVTSKKNWYFF